MFDENQRQRRRNHLHPYLAGNFAPIHCTRLLTPCSYTGSIPKELAGGQYVRNGGNPLTNEDLARDAHWFDGDGMLSGVSFRRTGEKGTEIRPEFVNQYILTDVYIASKTSRFLKTPLLPSIAIMIDPLASLVTIALGILRAVFLVFLSHLPGSARAVKKISVANTAVLYHDGRALATCESGPPVRVLLPGLETVGWFNGKKAEGEFGGEIGSGFGGDGPLSFFKEWTTGHPRVDPRTSDLISYHCTFTPPYLHYSIVPSSQSRTSKATPLDPPRLLNVPVPGVSGAKMMHDFGVSFNHTIILDLPLSLTPLNLLANKPVVCYDPAAPSRFGVFPRYRPDLIRWFETNPCCIFHTANSWDTIETDASSGESELNVNMLVCRLTSHAIVYDAGNVGIPVATKPIPPEYAEEEQCRLYYYKFGLGNTAHSIRQQWALSAIPFEFPTLRDSASMSAARYIYGCSASDHSFGTAPGRAGKIDRIVKMDVHALIARGVQNPPEQIRGCVDMRNITDVVASTDPEDPIKIFVPPEGWYAQESRFVPRENSQSEDDGYLLTYMFDESQLDARGECPPDARSELWIIDARNMREVLARIHLPQRVPYGLHGNWFTESEIRHQRPVAAVRTLPEPGPHAEAGSPARRAWMRARGLIEKWLA